MGIALKGAVVAATCAFILLGGCGSTVRKQLPFATGAPAGSNASGRTELSLPTAGEIVSAILPGQPKMPDWRLKEEAIGTVLTWLQTADVVDGDVTLPPPPAHGHQPYLVLALRGGETLSIRQASDCVTTKRTDGSDMQTCTASAGQVFLIKEGETVRLRSPALADWLSAGWADDTWR